MTPLYQICENPIPSRCGSRYKGVAFDGCCFYFTCPELCEIAKYDSCFCEAESFQTCRPYTCICYDSGKNCFWATASRCFYKLFKLDCCFREIDCLTICPREDCGAMITGVSYDCRKKCLVVAFANCVMALDTDAPQNHKLLQKSCASWNTGVLSISPSYIVTEIHDATQSLAVYDRDFKLKYKLDIPDDYLVETVLFNPCTFHKGKKQHFYVLATKNCCYSYLLEWELDCSDLEICHCNFSLCHNHCGCAPCPKPPAPCRAQSCNDIIESIALIETALSHILNAEGEKLQKIIASTDDVEKILKANEVINETVVNVTHLEIVLHDKLTAISELCHRCKKDKSCDTEDEKPPHPLA